MARNPDTPRLNWDELIDKHSREGDSLSDTIGRMFESGDLAYDEEELPDWMGAGNSGLGDLGINAEKYLGIKPWDLGRSPVSGGAEKNSD